jgi:hypothetical protein
LDSLCSSDEPSFTGTLTDSLRSYSEPWLALLARTELLELEAAIEDLGADLCDEANPWEHIHEFGRSKQ